MSNKRMTLLIRGKQKEWLFEVIADPQYLEEWQADGISIEVIENIIPEWAADLGLSRVYAFFQDVFNFKNPFQ